MQIKDPEFPRVNVGARVEAVAATALGTDGVFKNDRCDADRAVDRPSPRLRPDMGQPPLPVKKLGNICVIGIVVGSDGLLLLA